MSGYNSDSEARRLARERCNHDLLKSEDEYVNMLEAIVKYIYTPLLTNASRCRVNPKQVQFVFVFLEHMLQFHMNFLGVIREAISVVPDFYKYSKFISMYEDYLKKYDEVVRVLASWRSMEFRQFVRLRLDNEKVKQHIETANLSALPWYLYRPFDRVKEYYRFLKDLERLSKKKDEDREYLVKLLQLFKPVYRKIKANEERLQTKTRLLEVQLQIHGINKSIVTNDRYFLFQKPCQMRRRMMGRRFKRITIYVCSDLFIWVSARGHYKGSYSLYDRDLQMGPVPSKGGKQDAEFYIGMKSEKHKRAVVCASDVQRDRILAKIIDARSRCLAKLETATDEERARIERKATQKLGPEMSTVSQSSLDMEPSISVSESATDIRPHKDMKYHQNGQLGRIEEHRSVGMLRDDSKEMSMDAVNRRLYTDTLQSPNMELSHSAQDAHSPVQSVSIALNGHRGGDRDRDRDRERGTAPTTPWDDESVISDVTAGTGGVGGTGTAHMNGHGSHGPKAGLKQAQKMRGGGSPQLGAIADEKVDSADERERERSRGRDGRDGRAERRLVSPRSAATMNGGSTPTGGTGGRSRNKPKHHDHRKCEKVIRGLRNRVTDLEATLKRKEERIKTLEMSNNSIRNTVFVTRNQVIRLQTQNEELKKRMHPRTQSIGITTLQDFRKLRRRNNPGMLSPTESPTPSSGNVGFGSAGASNGTSAKFRKSYPLQRSSSTVGFRTPYFRQ